MKLPRYKILLDDKIEIDELTLKTLSMATERLCKGEPIDYVIGFKEFHNLNLIVDSRVLIPRPETEELVETLIEEYGRQNKNFADIGTGSGAIALSLALAFPDSKIYATDISEKALEVAKLNAFKNNINNVIFLSGKGLTPIRTYMDEIDIIVSNPPYIKSEYIKNLEPKVKNYEPITALDGGVDGIEFFRDLFEALPSGKTFYFEIASYNEPLLTKLALEKLPNYILEFSNDSRGALRYAILRPKD